MANTTAANDSTHTKEQWIKMTEGIIGMVLNTLAWLVILRTKNLHNMTNYLLAYLAVIDSLTCFCLFLLYAMLGFAPENFIARYIYCWLIYSLFLQHITIYTSSFGLCVVTYERYIGIVHPLHYPRLLSAKKVSVIIFITWMIAGLLSCPLLFTKVASNDAQQACTETSSSQLLTTTGYSFAFIFTYFLPVTFMSWAYYKIQATLQISARQLRQQNVQAAANELLQARQKVVNMLMIVLGALFVLWTPHVIMIIFSVAKGQKEIYESPVALARITEGIYYINSVINPIIYIFKSKAFRKGLKDMVSCCISQSARPNQIDLE